MAFQTQAEKFCKVVKEIVGSDADDQGVVDAISGSMILYSSGRKNLKDLLEEIGECLGDSGASAEPSEIVARLAPLLRGLEWNQEISVGVYPDGSALAVVDDCDGQVEIHSVASREDAEDLIEG